MKMTAIITAALLAAGITTGTTSQPDIIPAAQLPAEPQTYTVTGTFNYYCDDIKNGGYYIRFEPDNVNLYEYYVDKPQDVCNPKLGAHYEVTIDAGEQRQCKCAGPCEEGAYCFKDDNTIVSIREI